MPVPGGNPGATDASRETPPGEPGEVDPVEPPGDDPGLPRSSKTPRRACRTAGDASASPASRSPSSRGPRAESAPPSRRGWRPSVAAPPTRSCSTIAPCPASTARFACVRSASPPRRGKHERDIHRRGARPRRRSSRGRRHPAGGERDSGRRRGRAGVRRAQRSRRARPARRRERRDARRVRAARARIADRHDGAHPGRDGDRQGCRRRDDPRALGQEDGALRSPRLRGRARKPVRERALRPRARRVQRSDGRPPGRVRGGARRDPLPRRDWRGAARF